MVVGKRSQAIRRSGLSPNMADASLDRHCRVAKAMLDAEAVLFSIVDVDRQFFPAHLGLIEPFATSGQTPLSHSFCQHVVAQDEPLVIPDTAVDPLVADNPARRDLAIGSYLGVPVRNERGVVLGALCVTNAGTRSWTEDDIAALLDVSASIEAELELRATTRRLGDRLTAERVAQEYQEALGQLSIATNRLQTIQSVADEIAERVAPAIGAELTSIAILDQDELHFTHGSSVASHVAQTWMTAPLEAEVPMAAAIRERRVIHLEDTASFDAYPPFVASAELLGLQSFRAIPFGDETLGLSGVLGIGWVVPIAAPDVPSVVDRIVELAESTLTRAWQFEVERSQARILERVVLPTALPDTSVYSIAGTYIAPDAGQRVGGDVYDVIVRGDNSVGVMIADAVGHDLTATRAAARLRHAVGVLIMEGYSPAKVVGAVNRYVAASPSKRLVTCVCLLFSADGASVTIANAGHPQPILRSGATATFVGPIGEMLLGRGAIAYSEETIPLSPGDAVLCFTDGLIDRRGRPFIESERWLLDFVEARPSNDPHAITTDLGNEIAGWDIDDDVAFLAISRREPMDQPRLQWARPAGEIRLGVLRSELATWLDDIQACNQPDLMLVATELVTNAREASEPDDDVTFSIRTLQETATPQVRIEVTNRNPPFVPPNEMPDSTSIRGRGIAITNALSRSIDISAENGFVTVAVVIDLASTA